MPADPVRELMILAKWLPTPAGILLKATCDLLQKQPHLGARKTKLKDHITIFLHRGPDFVLFCIFADWPWKQAVSKLSEIHHVKFFFRPGHRDADVVVLGAALLWW